MASFKSVLGLLLLLLFVWLGESRHIDGRYTRSIPSICLMPPPRADGICTIEIDGFYYDPATGNCEEYTISACHVTPGQSFGNQQDCIVKCVRGQRHNREYYRNE
ncbi:early lactation protein [Drosophila sulfurigaster albostrigata]|uniref:early lactation protein n=1 Tax=Drosophila sulfurigaster albostrigata TaxID=89887 RepID=UPI002D21A3E7|nr:early lactation protein [Drosophila sulfurigaster albostrigata]